MDRYGLKRVELTPVLLNCVSHWNVYIYIAKNDTRTFQCQLYFPLDALHVSDYISPSSGATIISCPLHLVYADMSGCCVAVEFCFLFIHIHIVG